MKAFHVDVLLTHVVMGWHDQVGQQRLGGIFLFPRRFKRDDLPQDFVRPQRAQQIKLTSSRAFRSMVSEIDNIPLSASFDC